MNLQEELELYHNEMKREAGVSKAGGKLMRSLPVYTLRPQFLSPHGGYLLEADREVTSNLSFHYVLLLPHKLLNAQCLIIGHGFNEGDYIKLYPWAYSLCKALRMAVILFPLSFHINRRSSSWLYLMRPSYRERREIPHNRCSSLLNAVVSQRMSEAPERFFRGALQSYRDVLDLIQEIASGRLQVSFLGKKIKPFQADSSVHLLGYSISGFLHLALLMTHGQGLLRNSRCVLFSTCASGRDMDPVSILVMDQHAFQALMEFYTSTHKTTISKEFQRWFYETDLGVWFQRLFLEQDREILHRKVRTLYRRLLVVADPKDAIFSLEDIRKNLGEGIRSLPVDLGRHEFPFNISSLEGRDFREIVAEIRRSYAPSPRYWASYRMWLDAVEKFFNGQDGELFGREDPFDRAELH